MSGPKSARIDPQQAALQRRAEGLKRQFQMRLRQFAGAPESRQERLRKQLEREYENLTAKLGKAGFATPPLNDLISDPQGWKALEQATTDSDRRSAVTIESLVNDAYLRTLSRYPDREELQTSVSFIEESETAAEGVQSLLWALVNTKEFIITH